MLNSNNDKNILPENSEKRKDFTTIKRDFETAYASGKDYTPELMDLSTAIAYSVVAKCIDPQRKTAAERDSVSKTGYDPRLTFKKGGKTDMDYFIVYNCAPLCFRIFLSSTSKQNPYMG